MKGEVERLGVTATDAIALWTEAGRPTITLGPGEECFDLEKLLGHPYVGDRHLAAIRAWLEKQQPEKSGEHG